MPWFGESWGAPMCAPEDRVDVPAGEPCGWCDEPIEPGGRGAAAYTSPGGADFVAYHLECWLRATLGSVGHIEGRCFCVLGAAGEEDPPGLTRRQAAVAAIAAHERKHGRRVI